jgi:hypothetical protein
VTVGDPRLGLALLLLYAAVSIRNCSNAGRTKCAWVSFVLPATIALALSLASQAVATEEENAEDFMGIHKIEIIFHEAGTTKNLDLMLSL